MAPSLDFNATLAEQLRDAGMQMRAMTKPQKQRQHDAPAQEDAQEHAPNQSPQQSQQPSPDQAQTHGAQAPQEHMAPTATPTATVTHAATPESAVAQTAEDAATHTATHQSSVAAHAAPSQAEEAEHTRLGAQEAQKNDEKNVQGAALHNSATPDRHSAYNAPAESHGESRDTKNAHKHNSKDSRKSNSAQDSNANSHAQNATDKATVTKAVTGTGAQAGHATAPAAGLHTAQATAANFASDAANTASGAANTASATAAHTASDTGAANASDAATVATSLADTATVGAPASMNTHTTLSTPAHTTGAVSASATALASATTSTAEAAHADTLADHLPQGSSEHDSLLHSSAHGLGYGHCHTANEGRGSTSTHDSARNSAHGGNTSHGGTGAELPDAASELWAMSHHSAAPTLSERSWTGGVRGAVLDALRGLAGGQGHVLVNLKRLATHTGISYGSVRNAMSRLTRSGDILTRQIRMADGHGVRVEFLTLPGQEGTRLMPSGQSGQSGPTTPFGQLGPSSGFGMAAAGHTVASTAGMTAYAQSMTPHSAQPQHEQGTDRQYAAHAGSQAPAQQHFQNAPQRHIEHTHALPVQGQGHEQGHKQEHTALATDAMTVAPTATNHGGYAAALPINSTAALPSVLQMPTPPLAAAPMAPSSPALAAFWQTDDSLFTCAWPHVAAAGLGMTLLRGLAPIFAVQGFDAAVLPRCLRYLDWELEHMGVHAEVAELAAAASSTDTPTAHEASIALEAAHQLTQTFMRTLQRRGSWPRPALYEEGED